MASEKEELLQKTYELLIQMSFYDLSLERGKEFLDQDLMGYGTNFDEQIFRLNDFVKLVRDQREQGAGLEIKVSNIKPIFRKVISDGNTAIFVDEATFTMCIDGNINELFLRLSLVFEYKNDKWLMVHFHSSVPVLSDGDTWHTNIWKKKNEELQLMVDERTAELNKSLIDLKAAQSQLIQSEKMASLGELTAGIAHEIQNPLNFVNNFSEVNEELLNEMKDELSKGKIDDAMTLADDAIANQKKIYHHGQRAETIVKGMLQHSRGSSDLKELTDINALADEYLRLAYHGLRAKDQNFNATMKTEFDESIEKINIVPQDIGRVILNLITNAFYAVNERHKACQAEPVEARQTYEPTVTISTRKIGEKVEIKVTDNGNGIPDSVKEKIFQPFFTTKPTGQGTGLGLSLSYDIVKAHGGELRVETKEEEGTMFIIQLSA